MRIGSTRSFYIHDVVGFTIVKSLRNSLQKMFGTIYQWIWGREIKYPSAYPSC